MIIVYAYVCGDILHTGHLLHLKNAKNLGDKLIVGVLTDEAVLSKKSKPVLSFRERMQLVQSIEFVDCVTTQDEYSPLKNIKNIKPDILVECATHEEQPANNFVKSYGGRVVSFPYYPEISSTQIKEKIKKNRG